ncbi:hypothetical protein BPNPMPFG_006299 [Mesorhizobium sp. AR07]|uniref:hypothetical protein n=1 Tax=Mesorhizobium sp. AR07 TaxID=2865838 RepID=UPI00215FB945|nr:hypothetical protein [Mesorhizobium sp. AR07]UVK44384.1 hypothetical protein BPNPMPFG_006299 [Mesorhizobium sp. AR07]
MLADEREQKKRRKARKRAVMPDGLTEAEQRTWRLKEQLRFEDAKKFAENARFESGLVDERLREGFKLLFPRKICGRWREGVCEKGLRSVAFGLPGQMLVASTHKRGDLRVSWDKAALGVESRSKLLSLDLPYLEGNKTFLSFWRIDLDMSWSSIESFKDDIHQLVGCKIPFAPHLVAGDELRDGTFVRPHLYFFLPPGEAVWNDPEDPRCNMCTVKFFEGVYYGIVDALKSIKADPGAPATTQRGKNPLSPLLLGFTMNDREFMSMSRWAGWVDTSLNRDALVRHAAAENAGLDIKTSNQFFTAVQKQAYSLLRRWYYNSDLRLRARDQGGIADELHQALEPVAQEMSARMCSHISEHQVTLMVARVSSYAAGAFDPARLEKDIVRKALMHIVDGLTTVRERQQVAAEYASKEKAEKTLRRLVGAWDSLAVESLHVSKAALAREAKVSRPTVYARWAELQAVLEVRNGCKVRCIDKKLPTGTAMPGLKGTALQDRRPLGKLHGQSEHPMAQTRTMAEIQPFVTRKRETAFRISRDVLHETHPGAVGPAWCGAQWLDEEDDEDAMLIAMQESFPAEDYVAAAEWLCEDP